MLLIQILTVFFALFAAARAFGRFRRGAISLQELVVWFALWLAVAVLVLHPDITQWIARMLGVGRGADAVFYISIVVLFYAVFKLQLKLRRQEQQLTQLVRKLALQSAPPDKVSTK